MKQEEKLIIDGLLRDPEFTVKALSTLKTEFFEDPAAQKVFTVIRDYVQKHNKNPSVTEVKADLDSIVTESDVFIKTAEYLEPLPDIVDPDWRVEKAENYIRDRAIFLAILEAVDITEGKSDKPKTAIPEVLSEALSISFDSDFGLDYFNDIDKRIDYYNQDEVKYPSKYTMFNKITNGGFERGTLNVVTGPTGFGKTILMSDEALFQARDRGLNVVYFTFEMSDTRIANRVDANALDIMLGNLKKHLSSLKQRFTEMKTALSKGSLHIKEFPPATTSALDLMNYIKEFEMKKGMKVDIIFVDYLNLMTSYRYNVNMGSYKVVGGVAEELIKLAKYFNIPVNSATQLTRGGQNNNQIDITMISESQMLSNTVDFLVALYDNEDLEKINRIMVKQLKNRYGDKNYYNTFMMGAERAKMRFFNVDESESDDLIENRSKTEETEKVKVPSDKFRNFSDLV